MSYTEITIYFFFYKYIFSLIQSRAHISTHPFSQRPLITNDFELYLSHYNVHSFLSFLDIVKSFNISFLHSLFSLLAFVQRTITMATHYNVIDSWTGRMVNFEANGDREKGLIVM